MSTRWIEWQRELAREGKWADDSAIPLAFRGYEWRMSIAVLGDYSDHQLIGRVKIEPGAGSDLAVMDAFGPVLHMGSTLWELSIAAGTGANSTGALPLDSDGDALVEFPMMLTLVPPSKPPYPLLGGIFIMAEPV